MSRSDAQRIAALEDTLRVVREEKRKAVDAYAREYNLHQMAVARSRRATKRAERAEELHEKACAKAGRLGDELVRLREGLEALAELVSDHAHESGCEGVEAGCLACVEEQARALLGGGEGQ